MHDRCRVDQQRVSVDIHEPRHTSMHVKFVPHADQLTMDLQLPIGLDRHIIAKTSIETCGIVYSD